MKLLTEYLDTKNLNFQFPTHPYGKRIEFFLKRNGFEKVEAPHTKPYDKNSESAKLLVELSEKNPKKRYIIGPDTNHSYIMFVGAEEVTEQNPIFECNVSIDDDMKRVRGKGNFMGGLLTPKSYINEMVQFKAFWEYKDFRERVIEHFNWR
jgi:hypothetical protein